MIQRFLPILFFAPLSSDFFSRTWQQVLQDDYQTPRISSFPFSLLTDTQQLTCGAGPRANQIRCFNLKNGLSQTLDFPSSPSTQLIAYQDSWIIGTEDGLLVKTMIHPQGGPLYRAHKNLRLLVEDIKKNTFSPIEYGWHWATYHPSPWANLKIHNNTLFAQTYDGFLSAIDVNNGKEIWSKGLFKSPSSHTLLLTPQFHIFDNKIWVFSDSQIKILDTTGSLLFQDNLILKNDLTLPVAWAPLQVLQKGSCIFMLYPHKLFCFSKDQHKKIWEIKGKFSSMLIKEDVLWVAEDPSKILIVSPDNGLVQNEYILDLKGKISFLHIPPQSPDVWGLIKIPRSDRQVWVRLANGTIQQSDHFPYLLSPLNPVIFSNPDKTCLSTKHLSPLCIKNQTAITLVRP